MVAMARPIRMSSLFTWCFWLIFKRVSLFCGCTFSLEGEYLSHYEGRVPHIPLTTFYYYL
jgi:hypothetical protein